MKNKTGISKIDYLDRYLENLDLGYEYDTAIFVSFFLIHDLFVIQIKEECVFTLNDKSYYFNLN